MKPVIIKDLKEVFRNRYMFFTIILAPILGGLFGAFIMAAVMNLNPQEVGSQEPGGEAIIDVPVVVASPEIAVLFKGVAPLYDSLDLALESRGYAVYVEKVEAGFRITLVVDFGKLIVERGPLQAVMDPLRGSSAIGAYLEALFNRAAREEAVSVERVIDVVGVEGIRLAGAMMIAGVLAAASFFLTGSLFSASLMSVGSDREQRVLELLASTPLTMKTYVMAKIASALLVGLLGGISSVIGMMIYILVLARSLSGSMAAGPLASLARDSLAAVATPGVVAASAAAIILTILLGVSVSMLLAILLASDARGGDFTSSFIYIIMLMVAVVALLSPLRLPYTLLYAINPLTAGPVLVVLVASNNLVEAATVALLSASLIGFSVYVSVKIADPERMVQHRPLLTILRPRRFSAGSAS